MSQKMDNNGLREQVMINQFVLAAGCSRDQAAAILAQASWQFQTALSIYFQEAAIPKNGAGFSLITPANTPATPPNFPDALSMFSNLSTSDNKMATSPLASNSVSPRSNNQSKNSFSPMMSPPPPPPQFHVQNQQQGFIQSNQSQAQPWRGHVSPNAGQHQQNFQHQNAVCDSSQAQQAQQDVSEANFLTMEMEGVPQ